jgi:FkbM family methyltransferase
MADFNDIKVFEFLQKNLNPEGIFVDVGANQGDYTNFLLGVTKEKSKIYSIELHPNTCETLNSKFAKSNSVEIINAAVSDVDGLIYYYKGHDSCTHNIIGHDMAYNQNELIGEIKSIRLDSILEKEKEINLIKIDVEGAELKVLIGMENIQHKVKNLLVECHLDEHWEDIKNLLLETYNFKCLNILNNESINKSSNRAYQCFCQK